MSNVVLGGKPVSFQLIDVLSPAPNAPDPVVQLFQTMIPDLSGSKTVSQGQKSVAATVPVIENFTPVATPGTSRKAQHLPDQALQKC